MLPFSPSFANWKLIATLKKLEPKLLQSTLSLWGREGHCVVTKDYPIAWIPSEEHFAKLLMSDLPSHFTRCTFVAGGVMTRSVDYSMPDITTQSKWFALASLEFTTNTMCYLLGCFSKPAVALTAHQCVGPSGPSGQLPLGTLCQSVSIQQSFGAP